MFVHLPTVVVDLVVAVIAYQREVFEVSWPLLRPPNDVMGSTPQRVGTTTDAVLVSGDQRDALSFSSGPQPASQPHVLGFGVKDRRQQVGFERQTVQLNDRYW